MKKKTTKANTPGRDIVLPSMFAKLDSDYKFLLECLVEVLEGLGLGEMASAIPSPDPSAPQKSPAKTVNRMRETHVLSMTFQLLNLVEENASAQARRTRETIEGLASEPGLWGQYLRQLKEAGFSGEQIAKSLANIHVEPVLTAHPTEAKRPTVLQIMRSVYLLLVSLENQMWTPMEREDLKRQIKAHLERLLLTSEMLLTKPGVMSELENVLYYLKEVFPSVLAKLDLRLRQSWIDEGFDPKLIADPGAYPKLTFGDWVGGDRDGHPLVTAEVTQSTLYTLRESAVSVIQGHIDTLLQRLSLSSRIQPPPPKLQKALDRMAEEIGPAADDVIEKTPLEPWRQFVALMKIKIENHLTENPARYRTAKQFAADLALLRQSLVEVGAARLAENDVFPVERVVAVFGFHLASLDVRQNSRFHEKAISQLLQAAGYEDYKYEEWDEPKRLEFMKKELRSSRPFVTRKTPVGEEAQRVLDCYRVLSDYHDKFDGEGIGSLIISMTRTLSDFLAVYLLTREVGLTRLNERGLVCVLPVVPLFETIDDLRNAAPIVEQFITHPVTVNSYALVGRARPVQQIMIGYSDSNTDGGYSASLWQLSRAQSEIARTATKHGVDICFFHGRGGTPSRGAGPTHRFLEALPHGSLTGNFRMTEQGETISQKYANAITATYNLELLLAGVTATTLCHSRPEKEDKNLAAAMESLAASSQEAYVALIHAEDFLTYWSEATPIDALEASSIGSRPVRRTGKRSFEDLRAIPWVFSWNQSRHYLPGWYGVGTALERLQKTDRALFTQLCENVSQWPILRNAMYNVETSLASASLKWMGEYASLVKSKMIRDHFLSLIEAEYHRTEHMINTLFRAPREKRRPRMIKTLRLRDAGLQRLHAYQIDTLREWRKRKKEGDEAKVQQILPAVLLSLNAVAAGLRTTG
ncbi:phosphoenolpyruvate carboxylase [Candidatus Sumerlaeota bacterium]|nr:phosphoenolpyruvate carboxylase [Candidatus Sumerlaeota bacterium]